MAEQRLIDANKEVIRAYEDIPEPYSDVLISFLRGCEPIDPETLPIVQQLRAELERVKAERDAAVSDLKTICDCDYCEGGCVSTEEECCMFCEVEGCLCRGCIGGVNWTWRGLQHRRGMLYVLRSRRLLVSRVHRRRKLDVARPAES